MHSEHVIVQFLYNIEEDQFHHNFVSHQCKRFHFYINLSFILNFSRSAETNCLHLVKMWSEVKTVKDENKRELKLSGAEISERIDAVGIDLNIFALESLNLLNISDTSLKALPKEISNLINLQTLLLYGNEIATIPETIGDLKVLKVLDLSRNKLESVPDSITKLHNITTINISNNQLSSFPSLKSFTKLSVIDLSCNQLVEYPEIVKENNILSEIYLKENSIEQIPFTIDTLVSLKHFSLAKNKVKKIPKSLCNISKLKGDFIWLKYRSIVSMFYLTLFR